MAPNCTPSLHGPSRLSQSSGATPPPPTPTLAGGDDIEATVFTKEEFQAMMRGECGPLPLPEDDELRSPLFYGEDVQLQSQPPGDAEPQAKQFSVDDLCANAPFSEAEIEQLAPLFNDEEIQAILALTQPPPPPSPPATKIGTANNDDQLISKERKQPSPPSPGEFRGDSEGCKPSPVHPPLAKKARKNKSLRAHHRAWHKRIAAHILRHRSRAPEPSRGLTALRCQCLELARSAAAEDDPRRGGCALHQGDAHGREWMQSARRHVPLVGGPGKVLAPKLAAGASTRQVVQYARWRRSVWMPTRFYVEHAVGCT